MAPTLGHQHPRVKLCRKLHQAKYRRELGLFLIEGPKLLQEARRAGVVIEEVFARADAADAETSARLVSAEVMAGMATTDSPPPVLALARTPLPLPAAAELPPLYPVLVGVQDAGNLGAMLRVAHAAGLADLGVAAGTVDSFNPKVLRSSMGSAFHVRTRPTGAAEQFASAMRERGYRLVATAVQGGIAIYDYDFRRPTVLLLGSEGSGLPPDWLGLADDTVIIPLRGSAESLNVAVAAGVIIFEALRQRNNSGIDP